MKYLGLAVLAVFALVVFAANFSAVESRYQCEGEVTSDSQPQPMTVFVKLHEYRWWVGLWSDSDGSVWIEIPNSVVEYFAHVKEVGDQLQIYNSPDALIKGSYSTLSKSLFVITNLGVFEGTCKSIQPER